MNNRNEVNKLKIMSCWIFVVVAIALGIRNVSDNNIDNNKSSVKMCIRDRQVRVAMVPAQNKVLEEKQKELQVKYDNALEEISKTPAVAQIIYDLKGLMSRSNVEMRALSFSNSDVSEEEIKSSDGCLLYTSRCV